MLYLRKGIVYVPTLNQVKNGAYVELEPVGVAPVGDAAALRTIFQEAAERGNPVIPRYTFENKPEPIILKYAGLKSYAKFARDAVPWMIEEKGNQFQIIGKKKRKDRGWEDDPSQIINFPPGTNLDSVIDRIITVVQTTAS